MIPSLSWTAFRMQRTVPSRRACPTTRPLHIIGPAGCHGPPTVKLPTALSMISILRTISYTAYGIGRLSLCLDLGGSHGLRPFGAPDDAHRESRPIRERAAVAVTCPASPVGGPTLARSIYWGTRIWTTATWPAFATYRSWANPTPLESGCWILSSSLHVFAGWLHCGCHDRRLWRRGI